MTHKYKGKEYEVQTGPRGGHYIINDEGKKISVKVKIESTKKKSINSIKQQEEAPKLKKYICYYEKRDKNGELVDDFKEWTNAYSYDEAKRYFKDEYSNNPNIIISFITRE